MVQWILKLYVLADIGKMCHGNYMAKCLSKLMYEILRRLKRGSNISTKIRTSVKTLIIFSLTGRDWGATLSPFQALMRSNIDYVTITYMSAAECHLKKLDIAEHALELLEHPLEHPCRKQEYSH